MKRWKIHNKWRQSKTHSGSLVAIDKMHEVFELPNQDADSVKDPMVEEENPNSIMKQIFNFKPQPPMLVFNILSAASNAEEELTNPNSTTNQQHKYQKVYKIIEPE